MPVRDDGYISGSYIRAHIRRSYIRAHIYAVVQDGATALHIVCSYGHIDVAKILLSNGVDVDAVVGFGGATGLHVACHNGHVDLVNHVREGTTCLSTLYSYRIYRVR